MQLGFHLQSQYWGGGWSQVDEFKVIHSLLYSKLEANGVRETLSLMGVWRAGEMAGG